MNHTGRFVHPEVRKEVIKEFHSMRKRHPDFDGDTLWALSRDYVWTLALADSAIIRCGMVL